VLFLDMSGQQNAVLLQHVSGLQELVPCCTRTLLVCMARVAPRRAWFTGAWAALGPGRSARANAAPGHGFSTWTCSSSRHV